MTSTTKAWKHVKRGTIYTVLCHTTKNNVIYVAHVDGRVFWRPIEEFYDGRFVRCDESCLTNDEMGVTRG